VAKFDAWTRGPLDEAVERDEVVTNVMVYWLTGTAGSALRFYYDDAKADKAEQAEPTTVPLGLGASKAGDFKSIRRFADRDHKNIVSWNTLDGEGHYLAHTATDAYTADVRQFFAGLTQS
jgi:hypothetical protein